MGGFGSGRRGGYGRDTVEDHRSIDVDHLRREGVLVDGWRGSWAWWRDGERTADIVIVGGRSRIGLRYRVRSGGGDWQDVDEPVEVSWRPCRFGGARPFFACPRCSRAVIKLYGAGRYFLCRTCHDLAYASQAEREHDRALRRANRLRARLGGEMADSIPSRPKGMHRTSYERLVGQIELLEAAADDYAAQLFLRLGQRLDPSPRSFWR